LNTSQLFFIKGWRSAFFFITGRDTTKTEELPFFTCLIFLNLQEIFIWFLIIYFFFNIIFYYLEARNLASSNDCKYCEVSQWFYQLKFARLKQSTEFESILLAFTKE
jgi:hypothetical protein